MRIEYCFCTYKLRFCSRTSGSALRILLLYLKLTIFGPERMLLFLLETCNFRAGTAQAHFAYYFCAEKLRVGSRSPGNALRAILS